MASYCALAALAVDHPNFPQGPLRLDLYLNNLPAHSPPQLSLVQYPDQYMN